jgi:hypothetical protein
LFGYKHNSYTTNADAAINGKTASLATTNSAPFNVVTNDFVTGQLVLIRNQRATVQVTIAGTTATGSGILYSNAANGKVRTFLCGSGQTNTITLRVQPNSLVAVTNAAVMPDTSSIVYE